MPASQRCERGVDGSAQAVMFVVGIPEMVAEYAVPHADELVGAVEA